MRTLRLFTITAALAALVATAGVASAGKTSPRAKPQSTCPVTGKPIDKEVSTVYGGQKVYFCCPKCVATFAKEPETYLAKLGERGEVVESQQKFCPVSGDAIDPKVSVDYAGRHVFFCCKMCIADFKADPAKYLPLIGRTTAPADAGMHPEQPAPKGDQRDAGGPGASTGTGAHHAN